MAAFGLGVFLGVEDHHSITEGLQQKRNAAGDLIEEGVHQVGQHEADEVGAARDHATGDPIGLIPLPAGACLRTLSRVPFADVFAIAQRLGDGHLRNAFVGGDIFPFLRPRLLYYCPNAGAGRE